MALSGTKASGAAEDVEQRGHLWVVFMTPVAVTLQQVNVALSKLKGLLGCVENHSRVIGTPDNIKVLK